MVVEGGRVCLRESEKGRKNEEGGRREEGGEVRSRREEGDEQGERSKYVVLASSK